MEKHLISQYISDIITLVSFLITLGTFFYALFIKREIKDVKKKVLYNTRISEHIEKLESSNLIFFNSIGNDLKKTRLILFQLKSRIEIINNIVPYQEKRECEVCLCIIKKMLRCNTVVEQKKYSKYRIWKRYITEELLYDNYGKISSLIDKLNSAKLDNTIVS